MDDFDDFEDFEDFDDFEDDFDDSFAFEDDFEKEYNKEDIDIFNEKPLEVDSGYEKTAIEVHITEQLSSSKIITLMDTYPSLKRITCPPSLYNRISPKYLSALEELGVSVEKKYNYGQNRKYSDEEINQVVDLLKSGKSPKEVVKELNISLEKVHYLKSKYPEYFKLNNHKKKYGDETREKIRKMRKNGLKPKEIAELENIPIRSIYYILNKK